MSYRFFLPPFFLALFLAAFLAGLLAFFIVFLADFFAAFLAGFLAAFFFAAFLAGFFLAAAFFLGFAAGFGFEGLGVAGAAAGVSDIGAGAGGSNGVGAGSIHPESVQLISISCSSAMGFLQRLPRRDTRRRCTGNQPVTRNCNEEKMHFFRSCARHRSVINSWSKITAR